MDRLAASGIFLQHGGNIRFSACGIVRIQLQNHLRERVFRDDISGRKSVRCLKFMCVIMIAGPDSVRRRLFRNSLQAVREFLPSIRDGRIEPRHTDIPVAERQIPPENGVREFPLEMHAAEFQSGAAGFPCCVRLRDAYIPPERIFKSSGGRFRKKDMERCAGRRGGLRQKSASCAKNPVGGSFLRM